MNINTQNTDQKRDNKVITLINNNEVREWIPAEMLRKWAAERRRAAKFSRELIKKIIGNDQNAKVLRAEISNNLITIEELARYYESLAEWKERTTDAGKL